MEEQNLVLVVLKILIMMVITFMIIMMMMMIIIIIIINLDKINSISAETDNFLIITNPRTKLKPTRLPPVSLLSEVKRRDRLVSRLSIRGDILQLPHSKSWWNA